MILGTLSISLIQADITNDVAKLRKMDPFAIFSLGNASVKTPIAKGGGKNPKWEDCN